MTANINQVPDSPDQSPVPELVHAIALIEAAGTILDAASRKPDLPFGEYAVTGLEPGQAVTVATVTADPHYTKSTSITLRRFTPDDAAYGVEIMRAGPTPSGSRVLRIDSIISTADSIIKATDEEYERVFGRDVLLGRTHLDLQTADIIPFVLDAAAQIGREQPTAARTGVLRRIMSRVIRH